MEIQFKQANRGNYSPGRAYPVEYIVVHYTANNGDTAKNNADYFARAVTKTSAHYFVDRDEIWQSVADGDTAYHCGSSNPVHPYCRNANSIGVEMCDSLTFVPGAVREHTAELVRQLMQTYNVPVERVLRHYDVTGKRCPAPWVNNSAEWDKFKKMLEGDIVTQDQFNAMAAVWLNQMAASPASQWVTEKTEAHPTGILEEAKAKGIFDGTRPKSFATREEVAAMVNALSKG